MSCFPLLSTALQAVRGRVLRATPIVGRHGFANHALPRRPARPFEIFARDQPRPRSRAPRLWAARKGIGVVGTGDFTHPAWRAELKEKLVPAEPGLFRLRDDIEQAVAATLPPACRAPVRFMLEVEISTIYKKGDKHPQNPPPDLRARLRDRRPHRRRGSRASATSPPTAGRSSVSTRATCWRSRSSPGPDAYLVPAHIWTPWFAALGSQSGFDSIADCYGDLADHIFAVETGLSSDPPMNWRVSFLDRYRLTSNSDAHSPGKLGREATTFDCDLDYFAHRAARWRPAHGYVGTVEFFPEEGKYHLDGHRKCDVRLTPEGDAGARRALPGLRRAASPSASSIASRCWPTAARRRRRRRRPPARSRTWCRCRRCSPRSPRSGPSIARRSSAATTRRSRALGAGARRSCRRCRSRTSRAPARRCWPRRSRGCAPAR